MPNELADSELLVAAESARRLPHPVLAIALAILFDVAPFAIFLTVIAIDRMPDRLLPAALFQTALLAVVYGLYIVQISIWVNKWEGRSVLSLGLNPLGAWPKFLRGAVLGIGSYLGLLAVLAAIGFADFRSDPSPGPVWALGLAAAIVLIGWLIQGPAEEILYRGWLLPVVSARSRLRWGIVASTVIFAVTHLLGSAFAPMLMVNLVFFGVFFALWALREGALWGVFGWHAAVNWVSENLVVLGEGFGVGPLADGLFLRIRQSGPDILTGGEVGLEASLLTTLVLVVAIAGLALWRRAEFEPADASS